MTLTYWEEAAGLVLAAKECNMNVTISFTIETDHKLASGVTLLEAIKKVDEASGGYAKDFSINCCHPTHFEPALAELDPATLARVNQIRVNASKKSHAELDESTELDYGNIEELAGEVAALKQKYGLTVIGGCCGTDARHLDAMMKHIHKN